MVGPIGSADPNAHAERLTRQLRRTVVNPTRSSRRKACSLRQPFEVSHTGGPALRHPRRGRPGLPISLIETLPGGNIAAMATDRQRGTIHLAETGFDITVPIIIGIAALVLGILLVGWAFLRRPRGPAEAPTPPSHSSEV